MKAKLICLTMIFAAVAILFSSCKKKEVPVVQPPVAVVKMTEEQFLLKLGERADVKNLKIGDSLVVAISPGEVLSPSAEFAVVKPFKANWGYYELLPVSKKLPLTIVWVGRKGSHLLVSDYPDLRDYYKPGENFLVLDPKPVCSVKVGNKEYWIGPSGKFWKTR